MLTMIHSNHASIDDGVFRVDRKFHVGMLEYTRKIRAPLVTVHPEMVPGMQVMDMIGVPLDELPYGVMTLKADASARLMPGEATRLGDQVARSKLVYGGAFGGAKIARDLGVPYVLILEYDLATNIAVSTTQVSGLARKAVRTARALWHHASVHLADVRGASRIHCNGYPVFDESTRLNPDCLLYLDSRMAADLVIPVTALERRLSGREEHPSPLRLLYSGRFEPMKGAVDAVRVGLACLERGLDVEMHCYGQGSSRPEMDRLAALPAAKGKIQIHDPVTYPELVRISHGFDAFVCCHTQNDPSCTYLETFGAGLPIVGYANRMWSRLSRESQVGFCSPMRQPDRVADGIQTLIADSPTLAAMSRRARQFALDHEFENEFGLRIDDLNVEYSANTSNAPKRLTVRSGLIKAARGVSAETRMEPT
jgi:colanic acid/amylovoran biosynthesis glycosyltransferase